MKTKTGSITATIHRYAKLHRILAALCAMWLTTVIPATAMAQNKANSLPSDTLILGSINEIQSLAPYAYMTIDKSGRITPEILISRHKDNKRGELQDNNVLYIGKIPDPVWLVFSIYNDTDTEDWVLDFGNLGNGRSGLIKKYDIQNYTSGKLYQSVDYSTKFFFTSNALPLKIPSRTLSIFTARIEGDDGLPLTLTPEIKTQTKQLEILLQGQSYDIWIAVFFISVMSFFTAFFFFKRYLPTLPLIGYFSLFYISLFLMDGFIISSLPYHSILFKIVLSGTFILSLLATKLFVRIPISRYPLENYALAGLAGFMLIASLIYIFVFPAENIGYLAFAGCSILVMLSNILVCILTKHNNSAATISYCLVWLLGIFAMIITMMANMNIIAVNVWTIHAFWISLLPQAFLLGLSLIYGYKDILIERQRIRAQKKQEEKNLVRLQKSKESADQARLLRVIERERELMKELREREIKRTEEMRIAKNAADKANQAKSAFLAVVSHEIRTPMTSILGMVRLIMDTNLDNKQRNYIDTIRKSGETMMALLNDILDFEKIEHGSMDLEIMPFSPDQLAQDIITLTSGHAAQKSLSITKQVAPDVPRQLMGDPTRLRQVLLNLVSNGIKFTERGGITIYIECVKNENEVATTQDNTILINFRVQDTGIGISESAQKKLFTPFAQAETSTTRKYGGTGLGLAISSKLVEAMKGNIQVTSQENEGSTFYFTIPLPVADNQTDTQESTDNRSQTSTHNTKPMRILVTEDNEMNRQVLQGLLEKDGHMVFQAANGSEALEQCQKERPELILMDIEMGGMNGEETTKKIRKHPDSSIASIPVIALTGNVMLEDIERYFESQMNGFIAKPIDPDKLYQTIDDASKGKFENPLTEKATVQNETKTKELILSENSEDILQKDINKPENPLAHVNHDLQLDDREHFVSDADLDKQASIETNMPPLTQPEETDLELPEDLPAIAKKEKPKLEEKPETQPKPVPISKQEADNELTEIQKYLLAMKPEEKTTSASATPEKQTISRPSPVQNTEEAGKTEADQNARPSQPETQTEIPDEPLENYLDLKLLGNLAQTLGKDQLKTLLDGFIDKADDIIEQLGSLIEHRDIAKISLRAHELKGMAGNFGMIALSKIAGQAEKAAKTNESEKALGHAAKLHDLNVKTKHHLKKWIESL